MSGLILDRNILPRVVVIDVEASGLHDTSFPIEVGWCFGDLRSGSFLIRPHESWSEEDWKWESEQVHRISMRDCLRHGIEVEEAAVRLNETLQGHDVLASAPDFDGMWIRRLFETANIKPAFHVMSYKTVLRGITKELTESQQDDLLNKVRNLFPYTHRAEEDARYMAALLIASGGCYDDLERAVSPLRP